MRYVWKVLQIAGQGVLGWMAPRILIWAGVPLEQWSQSIGRYLRMSADNLLTLSAVVLALLMMTAEFWWKGGAKLIGRLKERKATQGIPEPSPGLETAPTDPWIPLPEAARLVYECARRLHHPLAGQSEELASLHGEATPEQILNFIAGHIAGKEIELRGRRLPSRQFEKVPRAKNGIYRSGGSIIGGSRGDFHDVTMLRADLERLLGEMASAHQ